MIELDLDALERRYPIEREYANLTDGELRALIQRLREAEFQVEGIRTAMHNAQTRIAQLELAVAEFLGEDGGGELYKRRKLRSALDGKDRPWYTNDPDDPSGMIPR